MNLPPKILIHGKEYSSIDEVEPELREDYQKMLEILKDADGDGLPDLFEGKIWKLDFNKIRQLREVALKLQNKGVDVRAHLSPGSSSQNITTIPAGNSKSSNTLLFIIGVIVVAFFLLGGIIFLLRSGMFS